ncbi:hypothetical protein VNO77_33222 [Canavalia gladiata]|uniref:N-alpha-acetyltransferase 40 n=1 Tax=Canavalia gladiata TaxID=3824 RepID=A0AAN9KBC9_CANGL
MESETLQRRRSSSDSHNIAPIREKRLKRSEVLAKKKAVEELIKASYAEKDHLAAFPSFRHFRINGLSVCLKSGHGNKLSSPVKHYIQNLLKLNMEGPYGLEWSEEEKVKRREMVAPEARYIFLHEVAISNADEKATMLTAEGTSTCCLEDSGSLLGFVQYRFILEEEIPVLYVYELQLEPRVQGKGLGKFLMQLVELMAQKNCMGAVMLTVQKANVLAMDFYISKLRYTISTTSPSKVNPMMEKSYEILCKTFNDEAKIILEVKHQPSSLIVDELDKDGSNYYSHFYRLRYSLNYRNKKIKEPFVYNLADLYCARPFHGIPLCIRKLDTPPLCWHPYQNVQDMSHRSVVTKHEEDIVSQYTLKYEVPLYPQILQLPYTSSLFTSKGMLLEAQDMFDEMIQRDLGESHMQDSFLMGCMTNDNGPPHDVINYLDALCASQHFDSKCLVSAYC